MKIQPFFQEHRCGSTLAQVMACCLTAPSHYLDQCWFIINEVSWHSPGRNSQEMLHIWRFFSLIPVWKFLFKIITTSLGDQGVNCLWLNDIKHWVPAFWVLLLGSLLPVHWILGAPECHPIVPVLLGFQNSAPEWNWRNVVIMRKCSVWSHFWLWLLVVSRVFPYFYCYLYICIYLYWLFIRLMSRANFFYHSDWQTYLFHVKMLFEI